MEIRHRIGISAPQEQVYGAVSSLEGLSGWWTRELDGDAAAGGTLRFFFGRPEPAAEMEVTEAIPSEQVSWRCVKGPDDWVGTRITFGLSRLEDETVLQFSQSDGRDPSAFMDHCSTKWGYLLLGLKASFEGGRATPYPEDAKISSWG